MDSLETLVREAFVEHAADAPSDEGLLAAVTERRRRPPGWLAAAVAAVLVLGIAVGVVVLRGRGSATQPARPPIPPVPSGMRAISYHGITVDVPVALRLNYQPCQPPRNEVEIFDGEEISCPDVTEPPPPGTVVELFPVRVEGALPRGAHLAPTHVEGGNVLRGAKIWSWSGHRQWTGFVVARSAGVTITVTAPSRAKIARILNTVRVTPVDDLGCPSRQPKEPISRRAPLDPVSAVVCDYSLLGSVPKNALIASAKLDRLGATTAASDVRHWILETRLVRPTWQTYRVTFSYANGSTRTVAVPVDAIRAWIRDGADLPPQ